MSRETYQIEIVWEDGQREMHEAESTFVAAQLAYQKRFGLGNPHTVSIAEANVIKPPEPGCYLDSHHGFHSNAVGIVRLAQGYGRPAVQICEDDDLDFLVEESDRAIEWLNEYRPLDCYSWDWNDGDFGLYLDELED